MARVAVTGAAGDVGRTTLEALEDAHDVTALMHNEHDDLEGELLEVADEADVREKIRGYDVVVHLAADPRPSAPWDSVLSANIDGTYNVYDAAVEAGVERVVFASTNHVTGAVNIADLSDPESMVERPEPVYPEGPDRPDSYYGVSKVAGEALGTYYADFHDVEVVNLRIGWLRTREQLDELQDPEDPDHGRYARAMWLSPRDLRQGMRLAVSEPIDENPLTVNLTSANDEAYLSLTKTRTALGYEPQDNATALYDTE